MSPQLPTHLPTPSPAEIATAQRTLYANGLSVRRAVVSDPYVDRSLANTTPFSAPLQEYVTGSAWGWVWSRPGLERKQRSLLNIAMLCALNRPVELGTHVRGAVRNGASEIEIRETLLQVAVYCGMPAAVEGFRITEGVLKEMKSNGEMEETSGDVD
ncbi:MAG: hypothetical protein M1819_004792 [Sarea resinae]|nr:MAG: hypothetical protein M1819_004792 [Sarea resinae]